MKLLILIESPNIFHWKSAKRKKTKWVGVLRQNLGQRVPMKKVKKLALSIGFSHILHVEYISMQQVVIVQTPESKFKANIARNATFEGC